MSRAPQETPAAINQGSDTVTQSPKGALRKRVAPTPPLPPGQLNVLQRCSQPADQSHFILLITGPSKPWVLPGSSLRVLSELPPSIYNGSVSDLPSPSTNVPRPFCSLR